MMKASELVSKAIDIAKNYKTLYVMGCFGAPMTAANKKRYTTNHSYNKAAARVKMINAASDDTFGFDCVCLIKLQRVLLKQTKRILMQSFLLILRR